MQTLASGERVLSLLEEEPQIEEVSGQATAEFADINCENIDFAYEEEQIFKRLFDLDFERQPDWNPWKKRFRKINAVKAADVVFY